jgi:O-antigen ligase
VAAIAGGAVVVICVCVPLVLARPAVLAGVTNRSAATLEVTTSFRTDTWRNVGRIWARRPALGYGAGQSSVRLALQNEANTTEASRRAGLPSAQGLWAASLVDAGILGFETWALFLGGVLVVAGLALVRRPGPFTLACFVALTAAVITGQTGEDRLDLTAWTLIGLALAAALREPSEQHGAHGDQ